MVPANYTVELHSLTKTTLFMRNAVRTRDLPLLLAVPYDLDRYTAAFAVITAVLRGDGILSEIDTFWQSDMAGIQLALLLESRARMNAGFEGVQEELAPLRG
ncbi:hypothetical protein NCC49_004014 [Naganishia albida]|nr:hypothetical protein NCC49_004014 [Naganishia albida]